MSSLLRKLQTNAKENAENILLVQLQDRALELGYSQSVINSALDATIKSGLITVTGFYNNLKDAHIKENK